MTTDENLSDQEVTLEEAVANNIVNGSIARVLFTLAEQTPSDEGVDYKLPYLCLFNGIKDVIDMLYKKHRGSTLAPEVYLSTIYVLKQLQADAEEIFLR